MFAASAAMGSHRPMTGASEEIGALYGAYAVLLRSIAIKKFRVPEDDAATLVHDVFATYLDGRNCTGRASSSGHAYAPRSSRG